jgi:hypothetical protein
MTEPLENTADQTDFAVYPPAAWLQWLLKM